MNRRTLLAATALALPTSVMAFDNGRRRLAFGVLGSGGKPLGNVGNLNFGVNIAGAEYAPWNGQSFPTTTDINYVASKGVTFVRMPIAWESLQTALLGTLNATYLNNLKAAIASLNAKGIGTIVDLHNFGAYVAQAQWTTTIGYAGNVGNPATGVNFLGDGTLTSASFVDVWTKLSTALVGTAGLIGYSLMNEPINTIAVNKATAPNYFGQATGQNNWFPINSMTTVIQAAGSNPLGAGFGPAWTLTAGAAFAAQEQQVTLTAVPWTASVYAKVTSGTKTGRLYLGASSGTFTATTSWTRYTFTATPAAGAANVGIGIDNSGDVIQFANFQVEVGSSASTYVPSAYAPYAQAVVTAIRVIDATTPIYICGIASSIAAVWQMYNYEMAVMTGGNLVFEAHQYFDGPQGVGGGGTYSGTFTSYGIDTNSGVQAVAPFLSWLTTTGAKGFLGEFNVVNSVTDNNAQWLPLQVNFLNAIHAQGVRGTMWEYISNGFQPSNNLNVIPVASVDDIRLMQMLAIH